MVYLPSSLSHISPPVPLGPPYPYTYLSCPPPSLDSSRGASTSSSPATLHHHPTTRLPHAMNIRSQPRRHLPHQRRTTTIPPVHHPTVKCLWIAFGSPCGRRRNGRWQLNLPRSNLSSVTEGRPHHHHCRLGHLSLINRTSSQRNCKKENHSKLTLPLSPFLFLPHPPFASLPPSAISATISPFSFVCPDRDPDRCFLSSAI